MRQPQSFYTFRFFFSGQLFLTLDILIRSFLFLKCEYSTVKRPAFIIDLEDSDVYNNQPVRNNCLSLVTGRRTSLGRDVVYELPALILACDIRKGRFCPQFLSQYTRKSLRTFSGSSRHPHPQTQNLLPACKRTAHKSSFSGHRHYGHIHGCQFLLYLRFTKF